MSAIITDQLRILNAKNFVAAASSDSNNYYAFVGLPNATDYSPSWDTTPPAPRPTPTPTPSIGTTTTFYCYYHM